MAKTVDGVVYAMHTFVVEGGTTGVTAQEALDRVAVEHPNVHLYEVVTVKANPGDVGIVMVGVSARVALLPAEEAVAFARQLAVARFPKTAAEEWAVVDADGVDLGSF